MFVGVALEEAAGYRIVLTGADAVTTERVDGRAGRQRTEPQALEEVPGFQVVPRAQCLTTTRWSPVRRRQCRVGGGGWGWGRQFYGVG